MSARCFVLVVCLLLLGFTQITHAAFPNAWQVTDNGTTTGSVASYRTDLLVNQAAVATNLSFRFALNARLADDFGGTESLGFSYGTGTNRFEVSFDHDANGNLIVLRPANGGTAFLTLRTNALTARVYHTHEIVYSNSDWR